MERHEARLPELGALNLVAEREELTETGLGSTARCCGRRRHRQANSVRVCSPTSRRVASLRPRSAGLTALTPAPRTLVQTGSCRRCSLIHPLHVVVDVPSRMTLFRATADKSGHAEYPRDRRDRIVEANRLAGAEATARQQPDHAWRWCADAAHWVVRGSGQRSIRQRSRRVRPPCAEWDVCT